MTQIRRFPVGVVRLDEPTGARTVSLDGWVNDEYDAQSYVGPGDAVLLTEDPPAEVPIPDLLTHPPELRRPFVATAVAWAAGHAAAVAWLRDSATFDYAIASEHGMGPYLHTQVEAMLEQVQRLWRQRQIPEHGGGCIHRDSSLLSLATAFGDLAATSAARFSQQN